MTAYIANESKEGIYFVKDGASDDLTDWCVGLGKEYTCIPPSIARMDIR